MVITWRAHSWSIESNAFAVSRKNSKCWELEATPSKKNLFMSVVWSIPFFPHKKPFWDGCTRSMTAGMIDLAMVAARILLSAL